MRAARQLRRRVDRRRSQRGGLRATTALDAATEMLIEAPPDDPTSLAVRDRLTRATRGEDGAAEWRGHLRTVQRVLARIEQ